MELYSYQLALVTPGIIPWDAIFLKHILHKPNFLIKARGRPQIGHLLYFLTPNLGFLCALFINAFLAKGLSSMNPTYVNRSNSLAGNK